MRRILFCFFLLLSFAVSAQSRFVYHSSGLKIRLENNGERMFIIEDGVFCLNMLFETGKLDFSQPDFGLLLSKGSNPYFSDQWGLMNTGQNDGVANIDIKVQKAWLLADGFGVKVAVIDEGVDLTHPDLYDNLLNGYDATDGLLGGSNGACKSNDAHGTACAGIIGAVDNNIGIIGVANKSSIIPIRIAYSSTDESQWITYSSWIADGIYQAWYNYHADILSNSWGGHDSLCVISTEIENAYTFGRNQAGCLIVAASGNYQTIFHSPSYSVSFPGNLTDYVISVGAISPCGERKSAASCDGEDWWGSCYGPELSVVAPGVLLSSTDIQFENGYNNSNSTSDYTDKDYTNHFNGTSGACPHVSGIAALLLSVNPYLTALETRNIIEQTAQKVGGYDYGIDTIHLNGKWNNELGYGLVDAHKAVTTAKLYHTNFSISGPVNMSTCEEYTYTLMGNVPNNFDIAWETSPYLYIVEGQGTPTIKVRALYPSVQNSITASISFMGAVGKTIKKENIVSVGQGYVPITNIDTIFKQNHTLIDEYSLGNTITIDSGAVLSITSTIYCTDNARLIVRPGGKLILDGGTLTSSCPSEMWQGIDVVGDRTKSQTAANLLHLNSFGNLNYGIRAEENNGGHKHGLQFTCNDFSRCGIDFYVVQNATVANCIGSLLIGADNVFQNTRTSSLYNAGSQSIGYYYSLGSNHAPYNSVNITAVSVKYANSCASTFCNTQPGPPPITLSGFQSDMNAYTTALAATTNADDTGNGNVGANDYSPLQQGGSATLSETAQTLSETYHEAVRAIMSGSVLDLVALEQWHAAAQPVADPYSLVETRFMEGYAKIFAENAEMANYADPTAGHAPLSEDAETANYAELQAIAERPPLTVKSIPDGVYALRVIDNQNRQFHHKIIIK